jgi:hypothetical protein
MIVHKDFASVGWAYYKAYKAGDEEIAGEILDFIDR